MIKNEMTTGDLVLVTVAGETYSLEFYGWWDDQRRICSLLVPHNGLTILAAFNQIICRLGQDPKVTKLNPEFFKKRRAG
jgi:hypothetical protein